MLKVESFRLGGLIVRFADAFNEKKVHGFFRGSGIECLMLETHDGPVASIDRDTMRELLPFFQRFVETGTIKAEE